MGFLKTLFAGLVAAVITVGLFFFMGYLIIPEEYEPPADVTPTERIVITRTIEPEPNVEPPPPPPDPVQPPDMLPTNPEPSESPILDPGPPVTPPPPPNEGGNDQGPLMTIAEPMVRIAPQFPDRCAQRGLSGEVLVEFDLAPDGTVLNPRIISADDHGCFNRSSLRAVAEWRYPPDRGDRIRRNVRVVLSFNLAQ